MNIEIKIQFNVLTFLLGLNLVIFVLAFLFTNSPVLLQTGTVQDTAFRLFGGQISLNIYNGEYWRLVTANFFHLEILHLVFNIISLYQIGQIAQYYYDGRKIFITYVLGGIGGVLLSYIISLLTHENVYSLGASASIFALIGLLLGGTFRRNRFGRDLPFSARDLLPFVLIALLFGFIPGLNINNWAHLGGLVTGVALGFLIPNSIVRVTNKFEQIVTSLLFWLSVVIFIVSFAALLLNAYNLLIK